MAADPTDEPDRSADDPERGVERTPGEEREDDAGREAVEELRARLDLLEAENRALREDRARRFRTRHRRSAAGLAVVGLVATAAALLFPGARNVLFALGATGLFGAVLTYYLSPGRFVSADVGEAAYDAYAGSVEDVIDALGLADARVYVPRGAETDPVRLFVPQHAAYAVPDRAALDSPFVVTDDPDERGVSLRPTGVPLLRELRGALSGSLASEPGTLADQLADGVVEAFELARWARADVEAGRVTLAVGGSAYGGVERVDHPIASLLAVGLAAGLDRPIVVETVAAEDDRADYLLTCRWSSADGDGESGDASAPEGARDA